MAEAIGQPFLSFFDTREPMQIDNPRQLDVFEDVLVHNALPMIGLTPLLKQHFTEQWEARQRLSVSDLKPKGFLGNLLGIVVSWTEDPLGTMPSIRGKLPHLSDDDVTAVRFTGELSSGKSCLGTLDRSIWYFRHPNPKGRAVPSYWRRIIGPDAGNNRATEHVELSKHRAAF